jgi:hypothetical protein
MKRGRLAVLALITVGVMTSTVIVAGGFFLLSATIGLPVPFVWCLVFGELIGPIELPISATGSPSLHAGSATPDSVSRNDNRAHFATVQQPRRKTACLRVARGAGESSAGQVRLTAAVTTARRSAAERALCRGFAQTVEGRPGSARNLIV